jgi:hypothetical protein
MEPRNSPVRMPFISVGSIQLFVGPASFASTEQMNVRSSTRATSVGSDCARKLLGLTWSRVSVPASTRASVRAVHSASLPSQTWTVSGVVRVTTCSIQACRAVCDVHRGAADGPGVTGVCVAAGVWMLIGLVLQ